MNRRGSAIMLCILFLVQSLAYPQELLHRTLPLNPQTKVSPNNVKLAFLQKYDVLCMALLIYKLDAVERSPKEVVKESIMREYDRAFFNLTGVKFDLEHIDLGKKGWTRYYPFSVHGEWYIMRIFKTEERVYQPEVSVLLEGDIEDPKVTFQILPGINRILEQCKIKPHDLLFSPQAIVSP